MIIPITTKQLGDIPYNVPVTLQYDIINDSQDFLEIKNITTSCGCTNEAMSINPIPPNQTAQLVITYSANARGNNSKSISFRQNGDSHTLYFSANVI